MARVAMPKYKLREGRVTSKVLLCLFILSKIKYKAHSGSSRTAVRFLFAQEVMKMLTSGTPP